MSACDLLKTSATPDNARKALKSTDAALAEGAKDRSDWAATAHRVRGEAYELLGQPREALEAFDQALSLDPKIGVKKRATALRKRLGVGR
jgi:tetratricopeptide (TPR) repeat protein